MSKIDIQGITPVYEYPSCLHDRPFIQFCETDRIPIKCQDPDIKELTQVCIKIVIRECKTVRTPLGKKQFVQAVKCIRVVFKGVGTGGTQYAVEAEIPFCFFIMLPDCMPEAGKVCVIVEDLAASLAGARCIAVSTLLLAAPLVKGEPGGCCFSDQASGLAKDIRCDIQLSCTPES